MNLLHQSKRLLIGTVLFSGLAFNASAQTEITKWQYGRDAAISLTYDDGIRTQFSKALPIMNRLGLPATFFIITGSIPGTNNMGKFIGRPVKEIIAETATVPTNKDNFFERSSAVGFLGYAGTIQYHTQAGSMLVSGKTAQAYKLMDDFYAKVRNNEFKPGYTTNDEMANEVGLTWDDVRKYEKQGHEFGSHTITHAMTPVLDDVNLKYELEKSKEDLMKQLGPKGTFSAECSYGVEDERVMNYALTVYPALRNRMPEPWLAELNRSSRKLPGSFDKEYVQWQRGATTKTPLPMMKSWVDTVLTHKSNWLVLVVHGVDGLGYEPMPSSMLDEYYTYIKSKETENKAWIATFGDVTKYMRERMAANVKETKGKTITVNLTHTLDKSMYNIPLTLKTYVSSSWKQVQVKQGTKTQKIKPLTDPKGTYVLYQAIPNTTSVQLSAI
jgi:peptidoglycan/xylan/chitin deacetylase (PgdA/CDA1 family)